MLNRNILKTLTLALSVAGSASALPFSFIYEGNSWGTMDLTVHDASTVRVDFTANSVPGFTDFQVTGFAFVLATGLNPTIIDGANGDGLEWIRLTNLNPIPNSANGDDTPDKQIWNFGLTEGQANTLNPPGVHPGQSDFFYLAGFSNLLNEGSIATNITLEGIRIQAITGTPLQVEGDVPNSLFLTGSPVTQTAAVPEPGTLALVGFGLVGLGFAARRKRK